MTSSLILKFNSTMVLSFFYLSHFSLRTSILLCNHFPTSAEQNEITLLIVSGM